jgi:hypothetical protein
MKTMQSIVKRLILATSVFVSVYGVYALAKICCGIPLCPPGQPCP